MLQNLKNKLLEDFKETSNRQKKRVIRVLLTEIAEVTEDQCKQHLHRAEDRLRAGLNVDEVKYLDGYLGWL